MKHVLAEVYIYVHPVFRQAHVELHRMIASVMQKNALLATDGTESLCGSVLLDDQTALVYVLTMIFRFDPERRKENSR